MVFGVAGGKFKFKIVGGVAGVPRVRPNSVLSFTGHSGRCNMTYSEHPS